MTDFLKTRLLDTLSDQIRKIQKVRECKGISKRQGSPVPAVAGVGTAQGQGSGLSTDVLPGEPAWGRAEGWPLGRLCSQPKCSQPSRRGREGRPGSTLPGTGAGCAAGKRPRGAAWCGLRGCAGTRAGCTGQGQALPQSLSKAADRLESPSTHSRREQHVTWVFSETCSQAQGEEGAASQHQTTASTAGAVPAQKLL